MHPELRALLLADEEGALHSRADALERALAGVSAPRSPEMLLERLVAFGVTANDIVLDLGCGHGQFARQITAATGARVVATDVSAARAMETLEAARSAGDERVRTLRAAAEALPLRDRALRFVWCRDMLNHVDLPGAMRECARILVPGGAMLVYQTFAADSLEPREADRIYRTFSIVPRNMDPLYFERCAGGAGFAVAERDVIGGEWREWWEDDGARRTSQSLLRASRLLRASDDLRREFGDAAYEFAFADQLWGIYQMIGKLQPTAYVLRRE